MFSILKGFTPSPTVPAFIKLSWDNKEVSPRSMRASGVITKFAILCVIFSDKYCLDISVTSITLSLPAFAFTASSISVAPGIFINSSRVDAVAINFGMSKLTKLLPSKSVS